MRNPKKSKKKKKAQKAQQDALTAEVPEVDEAAGPSASEVWRAGVHEVLEGEALQYDTTAYDCLHQLSLEWPCLSFDVVKDELGAPRSNWPHTLSMVAGTQAASAPLNHLAIMRLSNLGQAGHGPKAAAAREEDDMSDSDDDEEEPPVLGSRRVAHHGAVNRVKACWQQPGLVATWGELGQVQVWDVSPQLQELAAAGGTAGTKSTLVQVPPRHMHRHKAEGFALDWSRVTAGRLAAGDCQANIHVSDPTEAGRWATSGAYRGHSSSVEDLQWSPTEATVFASCSADHSIRIWDTRERTKPMISVPAHECDVNVISWNRGVTYMLASGGDDGGLRVWDLRSFREGGFVANFTYHGEYISGVEWCPHESSMLATTSGDGQLGVWDLAVERDPEEEAVLAPDTNALAPPDLPPQLLFVHSGQRNMKEVHWHPQIPGLLISTAEDGFNVFKPNNIDLK